VRDNGEDPRLTHGCCRRGIGRHRRALWPVATGQSAQSLTLHILLNGQIQGELSTSPDVESPPHPNPLPANSGAREFTAFAATVHPNTVFPLLMTVTLRAFTFASNEITLLSFHISIVIVSPG